MPHTASDSRRAELVRGVAIALLTIAYLGAVAGAMPVYNETTEEMLLARDGLASGIFEGGNPTSFPGIRAGAGIVRYFASVFAVGLGVVAHQVIMSMIWGLCMALFDRAVRRRFGGDVGWAPVGILLPVLIVAAAFPIADTGYLSAPSLVASTLALLAVVTSGSTAAATASGASMAFAAEAHPVTLLGVPVFVLATAMSCTRPVVALSLGLVSALGTGLAISFHPWVGNARTLLGTPWSVPLIAGAVAGPLLIAALGRRKWRALDADRRSLLLLVVIVGSNVAGIVLASIGARRTLLMPHYLLFSLPALAILAALALRRLRTLGRLGRLAALALPVGVISFDLLFAAVWRFGVSTGTTNVPNYSMREAERLAQHFWAKGYSFPDVQRHLRGPQSLELMGAIGVFAPSADDAPERPMEDIRVLAFSERHRPDGPVPAGGEELDLGFRRRAWILPLDGWVRLAPSRVCFEPGSDAGGTADCVDIASDSIAYTGRYHDLSARVFPALRAARWQNDGSRPRVPRNFTWELPVEITGNDAERHFDLVGLIGVVPWRIERVEGVAYRGDLPARHVVLERGAKLSGRIVLAAAPSQMTLKEYPPDFLETRPEEGALRRSLERLPPLGRRMCESLGTCPGGAAD